MSSSAVAKPVTLHAHHLANLPDVQVNFLVLLYEDAVLAILHHLDFPTLMALRHTCLDADRYVSMHLDSVMMTILSHFLHSSLNFRNFMRMTKAIISGSCVASFFLQTTMIPPPGADLDIYVPAGLRKRFEKYLVTVEGYTCDGDINPFRDYAGGIHVTSRLKRGELQIDLVESLTACAYHPLPFFYGTHLVSVLLGQRLISWSMPDAHLVQAMRKYEGRGVTFAMHEYQWSPDRCCDRGAACPKTARYFGDKWCLHGSFHTYAEEQDRAKGSDVLLDLNVIWWRGGQACGGACAASGRGILPMEAMTLDSCTAVTIMPIWHASYYYGRNVERSYRFHAWVMFEISLLHVLRRLARELEFKDLRNNIYTLSTVPPAAISWRGPIDDPHHQIMQIMPGSIQSDSACTMAAKSRVRIFGMWEHTHLLNGTFYLTLELLRPRDELAARNIGLLTGTVDSFHVVAAYSGLASSDIFSAPVYDGTAGIKDNMPELTMNMVAENDIIALDCTVMRMYSVPLGWTVYTSFTHITVIHPMADAPDNRDSDDEL
ncbi:hypothetical protein CERSUDRAFT_78580 [Gelatoporia subvermispora B]|uniref:Uncharacterized protein n=1 Tax=Ceriporiopsis subvermispora (strain B) TaxID=914234 RepID=M2QFR4_CERS8|nr:hypothetical protein CERSUDRAFT_78580 [Gelatoporia subvermispora B]